MHKQHIIATVRVTAVGSQVGWIRTAKTVHITNTTPGWMVRILDEWGKAK